ncbi:hypothetical protein [Sphingomonas sp. Ag1]|uniref:hypothetical protein n=1 Tax=Sphingomonas sp. Ag1 TaxID=1642949 RepID=UPI000622B27C|nr:hypothetical protein [Sphingomonas sp. Ag1]KKI21969.1 hypothetical protein XM50_01365 [Sphingomonas sp. Ag1]
MSDWPYKIEDYPPKYIKHLRELHGDDDAFLLRLLEDFELAPDEAPHDMLTGGTGAMVTFEKGQAPCVNYTFHLGDGYKDIAVRADGTIYFESHTGEDEDQIIERIEHCQRMFKGTFWLQSWPENHISPDIQCWFLVCSDKADAASYKLVFGGAQ